MPSLHSPSAPESPYNTKLKAGKRPRKVAHNLKIVTAVRQQPSEVGYFWFKRLFDITVSLALLTLTFPVMLLVALIIRLSSPGPIIYSQKRLTERGRIFTIFKFRTMVLNAEAGTGAVWAGEKDPRVTRLGKFLRVTRLDELPQLLNVLIGDMSLIGPRPERPEFAEQLSKELPGFNKRLQVKAGLTGLAQVGSGYASSVDSYRTKLAWDILYVKRKSILLDLKIAIKTFFVMITGSGAR